MRNVYVIPHTEASHHVDRVVGGWYDSTLTERGTRDASLVARALRSRIADGSAAEVWSSDLARARDTAQPIAELLGVTARIDPDLREQSYGRADGMPVGSMPYEPPPLDAHRMHHRSGEGAESRFEWASRAYASLERMLGTERQDIVIVTHGGTATYLVAAWIGMPIEVADRVKFAAKPGSITHLREDDHFRDREVVALNDLAHLQP